MVIACCVGTGVGAAYSLRNNNLRMLDLREAVFKADESGTGLNESLSELQQYVTTHMNTALPKLGDEKAIQLKSTYDRLVSAEAARVSAERVKITNEATAHCEASLPSVKLTERARCVQEYVEARPVSSVAIPKELYTFDFVSPFWAPDTAGLLIVGFIFFSVVLIIRTAVGYFVSRTLKRSM